MFGPVELRGLREKVGVFAAGFDAALVAPTVANAMVDDAAAIEKMAATVKALLAARVAETEVATREGDKTPAHALARKTGTTVGKAAEAICIGKRLAKQPKLDAAAREGKVSPEQAAAISDATEADPAAEGRLVDQAGHSTLSELRNECDRTKAAADRDAEERHRRILAARFARRRNCPDGSAEIVFHSTVEQVAEVWSVISGFATQAFNLARRDGRHEPAQAYAADGVLAMARAARGATAAAPAPAAGAAPVAPAAGPAQPPVPRRPPSPARIVVRIDWDALVRGWVTSDETCEIAGVGQVPVSVVRAMMATDDPFLAAVVTRGHDVVNVAHLGRRPNAHQLSALDWLAPTCRREGCDTTISLENDHRHDWATTRITLLGWIDRLCSHDHDLKTYDGWSLVEGTGKRPLVPPEDPRHPRHTRANRPPPAKEPTRSTDRSPTPAPEPAPGSGDDLAAAS